MIKVEHLSFAYDEKKVLTDVHFTVEKGQFVALIGHNGSGKSTLAKLLAGLMEVKEGTIQIDGIPLNPHTIQQLRPKLGIVFQNPDNQFIGATVADDVAFGLENRRVPHQEMQQEIDRVTKQVGMHGFLHQEPSNLSGGQKQRVAIAGILAMHPDIMIFDEATAMLDPEGKAEIHQTLLTLRQQYPSLTILLITHDLEEASLADEVLVLNQGKLVLQGTPKDVFLHVETLKNMSLDVPFLSQLRMSVPKEKRSLMHSLQDWVDLLP